MIDLVSLVRRCAEEIQMIHDDFPSLSDRIDREVRKDPEEIVASCDEELRAIQAHRRRFKY